MLYLIRLNVDIALLRNTPKYMLQHFLNMFTTLNC